MSTKIRLYNKNNFPLGEEILLLLEKIFFFIKQEMKLKNYQVELNIVDDEEMRKINKKYRGIDKTTDVLSFSFLSEIEIEELGILYMSYEEIKAFSEKGFIFNCSFLFIHGVLHLLGFDHGKEMEQWEIKIKNQFFNF